MDYPIITSTLSINALGDENIVKGSIKLGTPITASCDIAIKDVPKEPVASKILASCDINIKDIPKSEVVTSKSAFCDINIKDIPITIPLHLTASCDITIEKALKLSYTEQFMLGYIYGYNSVKNNKITPNAIPLSVKDCSLWLDANQIKQDNNTKIAQWNDLSGNNNHATQTINDRQPMLIKENDKSKIVFDGSKGMDLNTINLEKGTVFLVAENTFESNGDMMLALGGLFRIGHWKGTKEIIFTPSYQETTCYHTIGMDNWNKNGVNIMSASRSALNTDVEVYFQGKKQPLLNQTNYWGGRSYSIGCCHNENFAYCMTGKISEIIVYNRVLTDEERNKIENYLINKWK